MLPCPYKPFSQYTSLLALVLARLRKAVALPAPEHVARLVLALLLALRLRRVPCRCWVLACLQTGIPAIFMRPVFSPDLSRQRALV